MKNKYFINLISITSSDKILNPSSLFLTCYSVVLLKMII